MQCHSSLSFTEITYIGTLNKFTKPCEWIESERRHVRQMCIAIIWYFCENSMIAGTGLVLKDAFAPWFASIPAILDFCENNEVIPTKSSNSRLNMLSLSYVFVDFILCKVRLIHWYTSIKRHQPSFISTQTDLSTSGSCTIQKALNSNSVLREVDYSKGRYI